MYVSVVEVASSALVVVSVDDVVVLSKEDVDRVDIVVVPVTSVALSE